MKKRPDVTWREICEAWIASQMCFAIHFRWSRKALLRELEMVRTRLRWVHPEFTHNKRAQEAWDEAVARMVPPRWTSRGKQLKQPFLPGMTP